MAAERDTANFAVFGQQLRDRADADVDAVIGEALLKCGDDVVGFVGRGKHAVAAFSLERNAQRFEKLHRILRGKSGKCGIEKFMSAGDVFQELRGRTVVGDVAAAFAGNGKLAADAAVFLAHENACAGCCRLDRGHRTGGTAADDDAVILYSQNSDHPFVVRQRPDTVGTGSSFKIAARFGSEFFKIASGRSARAAIGTAIDSLKNAVRRASYSSAENCSDGST